MPSRDGHLQFQKWAQEYGYAPLVCSVSSLLTALSPVYSLILGTKTLIVLSSDTAIKDLLDKRSGIYSDRQDMYIASDLISGGLRVLLMVCSKKSSRHPRNRSSHSSFTLVLPVPCSVD